MVRRRVRHPFASFATGLLVLALLSGWVVALAAAPRPAIAQAAREADPRPAQAALDAPGAPPIAPGLSPIPASPVAPASLAPATDPAPAKIPDLGYILELRLKAERLKLADTRFWHLLLHYEPTWFGIESQADGPGFFLAANGKYDPRAELAATIGAFFSARFLEPGKMTAQCTFPARYRWLKEQLAIDPQRLPDETCQRFLVWREALNPESVTFIFASYFLNNPASAFGHTLLRFDRAQRGESERLLDYAVNFAAAIPENENQIVYAYKGLFGHYGGYFSLLPYYAKVREYSDIDSRDLWEYKLSLTPAQIDWMVRHTWEMGATYFDYFFFGENCSYHLLSLIEIADPALHLRDRFYAWTLPSDTVRAISDQPGLVRSVSYRPSRGSQMAQKVERLSPAEQRLVAQLIDRPETEPPGFADLPPLSQALVLDAASDYFQFKLGDAAGDLEKLLRAKLRSLLLRRSRLRVTYDAESFPRHSDPPEIGHLVSHLSLAVGEAAAGPRGTLDPGVPGHARDFVELGWRPSFHELLSEGQGYAPNSQVLLGDTRLRYFARHDRVELERFAILDAISLFPVTRVVQPLSWAVRFGFDRPHDGACRTCIPLGFNPGGGYTVESAGKRLVGYALAMADMQFDAALLNGYRAGLGAHGGLLVTLTPLWRAHLEASHVDYSAGQTGWTSRAALTQRITLDRDLELRVDASYLESDRLSAYREFKAGIGWFY